MIGKQRRRSAGGDEQYRPFILKALLRDAVDKPGHRFAGMTGSSKIPSSCASSFTAAIPSSFGVPYPGAK